jgi:hypothetical protein
MKIFQSQNFIVRAAPEPLVDRDDGGHVIIDPVVSVRDRQELIPKLAVEFMRLSVVTGQAMTTVMIKHGVDIGRINYQDNGNWSVFLPEGPHLHLHLYGRATNAKYQRYGQACYFPHKDENPGFYKHFQPLDAKDIFEIGNEIKRLLGTEKFSDKNWMI